MKLNFLNNLQDQVVNLAIAFENLYYREQSAESKNLVLSQIAQINKEIEEYEEQYQK